MNHASPHARSRAVTATKKIALAAPTPAPASAVAITITDYIASLDLPPFPKKVVGADRKSPTNLRCMAALAVYEVLPKLDHATVPTIAHASKLSVKEALIACKDLVACGLATSRVDSAEFTVYAVRTAS